MSYTTMRVEAQGGLTQITLDQGDGVNAIDDVMAQDLFAVAVRLSEDARVRAILIDAAGANFCVGGNLRAFPRGVDVLPGHLRRLTATFHSAVSLLAGGRAPIIVAVHGNVVGGGLAFPCLADVVIAAATTRFRLGYTSLGLIPDGGVSFYLPRLVGLRRAADLMLSNRVFSADDAAAWGLVSQVCDDDDLAQVALEYARSVANGPTIAFAATRRLLQSTLTSELEVQLARESVEIAAAAGSADAEEGISAFLEKRSAKFEDR